MIFLHICSQCLFRFWGSGFFKECNRHAACCRLWVKHVCIAMLITTNYFVGQSNIQLCNHCIYFTTCGHFNNNVDGLLFTEFSVCYGYFRKFQVTWPSSLVLIGSLAMTLSFVCKHKHVDFMVGYHNLQNCGSWVPNISHPEHCSGHPRKGLSRYVQMTQLSRCCRRPRYPSQEYTGMAGGALTFVVCGSFIITVTKVEYDDASLHPPLDPCFQIFFQWMPWKWKNNCDGKFGHQSHPHLTTRYITLFFKILIKCNIHIYLHLHRILW
jgi:Ni,Fe-hydrogenase I cytochrome b subunit